MSDIDTARLRALAEAATPGWWFVQMEKDSDEVVAIVSQYAVVQESGKKLSDPRADADFIAAANPVAVVRLLARIDSLERTVAAAGRALKEANEREAKSGREAQAWRALQIAARDPDFKIEADGGGLLLVMQSIEWAIEKAAIAAKEQTE